MEILVKRNGNLKKLGEGKIYSKRDLTLNENGVDAYLGSAEGAALGQKEAQKIKNTNPNVRNVTTDAGKLDRQNDTQSGEGMEFRVPMNANASQLAQVDKLAKDPRADDVAITFTDEKPGTSDSTNESRVFEMRKNSIPFTKSELYDFLKTI